MTTIAEQLEIITSAVGAIQELLLSAPQASVINVKAGSILQPIIDSAPVGATLALEDGGYVGSLVLNKPITIGPVNPPAPGRATPTARIWIAGSDQAITVTGDDVTLIGLGVRTSNPDQTVIGVTGSRFALDHCTVLGGPTGQHRGVMLNGDTATIAHCYIDECWLNGREGQAISGWDRTKHVTIDDCYLGGGAQSVMFGGADASSADRVPQDITITRSTLSKNPKWYSQGAMIKCALELKAAIGVTVSDCILEFAGISGGQGAYLILLTPRNQDGHAPWSSVQNVLIERCHARYGGGCVNLLGADYSNPSGPLKNVMIRNVAFTDIDPQGITQGNGRGFQFMGNCQNVTLESCTVQATNLASQMYVIAPAPTGLVLRNLKMSQSLYGIKIDNGGSGETALRSLCPDAVIELTAADVGAVGYPT